MTRIGWKIEAELSEKKYGFRPGRNPADLIFVIHQLIEKLGVQ